ncbi:MAG TPA: hypothetical protein VNN08_26485 [Thermoanaerobaculia bacterium]|nr:hypothetical protein [Thermoanaerobaculia bacterium]
MTLRLRISALALLVVLASTGAAIARTIVVPAGTPIRFKILRTISTASARPGQSVPAQLTAPIVVAGNTVASAGSPAVVHISNAESSGRIGGSASLTFSVASITLANGSTAHIRTSRYSREGKAHAKHNATIIGGAAILGALAGQAIGHDRDATAKGAAIGAGAGIGAAAATGKFDFQVPAGSRFRLTLRSPIHATF